MQRYSKHLMRDLLSYGGKGQQYFPQPVPDRSAETEAMTKEPPSQALRYASAIASVLLATLLRVPLDPFLGSDQSSALYLLAVIFTAWYGGLMPALLATGFGAIAARY